MRANATGFDEEQWVNDSQSLEMDGYMEELTHQDQCGQDKY